MNSVVSFKIKFKIKFDMKYRATTHTKKSLSQNKPEVVQVMFEEFTGKSKDLCNKIKVITRITIVETGTSTCIICRSCDGFRDTVIEFRKKCQESQHSILTTHSVKRVMSNPRHL